MDSIRLRRSLYAVASMTVSRFWTAADTVRALLGGDDDPLLPPRAVRSSYGGTARHFRRCGAEFLDHFVTLCGLQPHERVLDVGCGAGRMALPLTRYLGPAGSYHGFDAMAHQVDWCRRAISSRWPNFHFEVADVFSRYYNPGGRQRAAEYTFPYADASFDFVYLASVFTHMLPEDTARYLAEVARVLAPAGRCLVTWFLVDEGSERVVTRPVWSLLGALDFQDDRGTHRVVSREVPEAAVAYRWEWARALYEQCGLEVRDVRRGSWRGAPGLGFQDMVLAVKPAAAA